MISNQSSLLQNIQNRYLNPNGADVWFVFDDERIPGHRIILASSPWLESMFFGSLTENNDVNMNNSNVTSRSFKEFLRYIYTGNANLTMDNIDEMIFLADESLCQEIFDECEKFLIKNLTIDNIFVVYQLALRHERAVQLKIACEEEICVNAVHTLKSSKFSEIQFDFLQNILKCDSLVCEEKDVFNACIEWAKAACRRNRMDQYNPINLRAQLGDLIYQIRFSSMTVGDAATCIDSCPGLFTANELQEIMCIVGRKNYSGTTQFNCTERYFSLQRNPSKELKCDRFSFITSDRRIFALTETTTFTCNRPAFLKGFTCECNHCVNKTARVSIVETKGEENVNIRCNVQKNLIFGTKNTRKKRHGQIERTHTSFTAKVMFDSGILLRPGYEYSIHITFDSLLLLEHNCVLKKKVRVDHDIVIRFDKTNDIVTSLILNRFDNRKYFRRIFHNPVMWCILVGVLLVIAAIMRYDINQPDSVLVHLWHMIKSIFEKH
ncbi:BTB/POZ domain-containing protein 3-like [Contarinia nasturtii]|uniref:BTB/POZ domain-containing protein 3-like n=1 Tax=Contarinia nasturtii TaxID=265458 RepID=UPI0012D3D95B|nr:BTB/POZ domain-containing protein 3-like [Contarinia nasturtii]